MLKRRTDRKIDSWRPSIGAQRPVVKIYANTIKKDQRIVVKNMLEMMSEKGYPNPRSKGGRRRTLKRGGKYCKKYGGRKSKKCGCSMFSFR